MSPAQAAASKEKDADAVAVVGEAEEPAAKRHKAVAYCGVEYKCQLDSLARQIKIQQKENSQHGLKDRPVRAFTAAQHQVFERNKQLKSREVIGQKFQEVGVQAPTKRAIQRRIEGPPVDQRHLQVVLSMSALKNWLEGRTRERLQADGRLTPWTLVVAAYTLDPFAVHVVADLFFELA